MRSFGIWARNLFTILSHRPLQGHLFLSETVLLPIRLKLVSVHSLVPLVAHFTPILL